MSGYLESTRKLYITYLDLSRLNNGRALGTGKLTLSALSMQPLLSLDLDTKGRESAGRISKQICQAIATTLRVSEPAYLLQHGGLILLERSRLCLSLLQQNQLCVEVIHLGGKGKGGG